MGAPADRMRFETLAAYGVGLLLPVVEVCRRKTDFSNIPAYVDDFLIGGLLLLAAGWRARHPGVGRVLLVAAWALFCGGMYYSLFGQFAGTNREDVSGLSNDVVAVVKGILFAVGVVALIRSIRAAIPESGH